MSGIDEKGNVLLYPMVSNTIIQNHPPQANPKLWLAIPNHRSHIFIAFLPSNYHPRDIPTSPPLRAPTSVYLQFLFGIQKPRHHPRPISSITLHTLTVEKIGHCALDLLVDILQLQLVLLDFSQDALVNDCRYGRSSCPHLRALMGHASSAMMLANRCRRRREYGPTVRGGRG
jgi:hypothetical protein